MIKRFTKFYTKKALLALTGVNIKDIWQLGVRNLR